MQARREQIGLAVAAVSAGVGLIGVPSWQHALTEVCHLAMIFGALTIVVLSVTRLFGSSGIAVERVWSAAFLTGMPVVYIVSFLATGGSDSGAPWLAIEIAALPVFAGLALFGLAGRPWLIVVGIAAHGLAWDSWHLHSRYIPTWYAVGCLLADLGLSIYLALRLPSWKQARTPDRSVHHSTGLTGS